MGDVTLQARVMELEQVVAFLERAFKDHCANHTILTPVVRKPIVRKKTVSGRVKRGKTSQGC